MTVNRNAALRFISRYRPRLIVRDEASGLIEFAVALPLLCTFLFCFMEACLIIYSQNLISELACEGTRYAMVHGAACPSTTNPTCEATATQVNSFVSSINIPNLAVGTITPTTTYPDGNEAVGSRVQVKISYTFPITMPFVPKTAFNLTAISTTYIMQ
jgi:Flp pilus assembly protein TadG